MSCRKITDSKYSERPSPPYHANECKNKIMKGNDKKSYISKPNKNGIFKWYPLKSGKTPEEYYNQFPEKKIKKYIFPDKVLEAVKKDLLKENILFIKIGWKNVYDFIDDAWYDVTRLIEKKSIIKKIRQTDKKSDITNIISFIFYTDYRRFWSEINGELFLQYNILPKDKPKVIEIFKNYFGRRFIWNGSKNKALLIKLHKK